MKPGIYTVASWNNKDGVLIGPEGDFLTLTKSELPKVFGGILYVGEQIEVKQITTIEPILLSLDERQRAAWRREWDRINSQ